MKNLVIIILLGIIVALTCKVTSTDEASSTLDKYPTKASYISTLNVDR